MFKHFQELIPVIIVLLFSLYYAMKNTPPLLSICFDSNALPFPSSMNVLFMRTQTSNVNLQMNKISTKYLYEDRRVLRHENWVSHIQTRNN